MAETQEPHAPHRVFKMIDLKLTIEFSFHGSLSNVWMFASVVGMEPVLELSPTSGVRSQPPGVGHLEEVGWEMTKYISPHFADFFISVWSTLSDDSVILPKFTSSHNSILVIGLNVDAIFTWRQ
jgi:hypothetical protein